MLYEDASSIFRLAYSERRDALYVGCCSDNVHNSDNDANVLNGIQFHVYLELHTRNAVNTANCAVVVRHH